MASQKNLDIAYMRCASAIAELSYARRKKVGTIIVLNGQIISEGVNGTPKGFDNNCEEVTYEIDPIASVNLNEYQTLKTIEVLKTKSEVIHSESNAILKIARSTNSSVGATLYTTLTPCFDCAKQIIACGISRVVYGEKYPYEGHTGEVRFLGIELLKQANIQVDFLPLAELN